MPKRKANKREYNKFFSNNKGLIVTLMIILVFALTIAWFLNSRHMYKLCHNSKLSNIASSICNKYVIDKGYDDVFRSNNDADLEAFKTLKFEGHDLYDTQEKGFGAVALSFINLVKRRNDFQNFYLNFERKGPFFDAQEILKETQVPLHDHSYFYKHEESKEMIKKVQSLVIPGYDITYNPGIIKYKDGYLLSFRHDTHNISESKKISYKDRFIGLVKLDKDFNIIGEAKILNDLCISTNCRVEDPRLVTNNKEIWMVYNRQGDILDHKISFERDVYVATLTEKNDEINIKNTVRMVSPFNAKLEKNWAPFVYDDQLHFVYSVTPNHIILKPNVDTGYSTIVNETELNTNFQFGQLRNTSNFIQLERNKTYLGFLHSHIYTNKHWYYFSVPSILNCPGNANTCHINNINHTPLFFDLVPEVDTIVPVLLYISGAVDNGEEVIISAGKNDREILIITLDKKKLLNYINSENSID